MVDAQLANGAQATGRRFHRGLQQRLGIVRREHVHRQVELIELAISRLEHLEDLVHARLFALAPTDRVDARDLVAAQAEYAQAAGRESVCAQHGQRREVDGL